jgi:hypothetical protein
MHAAKTMIAGGIVALAIVVGAAEASALPAASVGYVTTARAMSGYCNIRLFIETLDAQGNVIGSHIGFVPGYVGGDDHVYFEVPIKVAGPAYRVSANSWLKCAGGGQ